MKYLWAVAHVKDPKPPALHLHLLKVFSYLHMETNYCYLQVGMNISK
jgi:hypothetical protein